MADGVGERHLAVCRRFGESVRAAIGKWERASPCDAWDARGVLEHVIGFHDVLLLRPLGLEPDRRLFERVVDIPELQGNPAVRRDARAMMPNLTRDVLVHTWDLARAVGADDRLDAGWCEQFYAALPSDLQALSPAGMFDAPVAVADHSDVQSKLLARLGRNPDWRPPDDQPS